MFIVEWIQSDFCFRCLKTSFSCIDSLHLIANFYFISPFELRRLTIEDLNESFDEFWIAIIWFSTSEQRRCESFILIRLLINPSTRASLKFQIQIHPVFGDSWIKRFECRILSINTNLLTIKISLTQNPLLSCVKIGNQC